jgi:hypothetical protein
MASLLVGSTVDAASSKAVGIKTAHLAKDRGLFAIDAAVKDMRRTQTVTDDHDHYDHDDAFQEVEGVNLFDDHAHEDENYEET